MYATGAGYALSSRFLNCISNQHLTPTNVTNRAKLLYWEDASVGILAQACNITLTPGSSKTWNVAALAVPYRFFGDLSQYAEQDAYNNDTDNSMIDLSTVTMTHGIHNPINHFRLNVNTGNTNVNRTKALAPIFSLYDIRKQLLCNPYQ